MATLNYSTRLNNIQARKYDAETNRTLVSESFRSLNIPEDIKYLMESMRPIDKSYNDKTLLAADNVKKHLENGLSLHFSRAYRTQGSVKSGTNIKTHSDIDLLAIIDKYFYPESYPQNPYTESDPDVDIRELRKQTTQVLSNIYQDVDASGESCVSIFNKSLKRKVDVAFCFWYNSAKYDQTQDEHYRGVRLYKYPSGTKKQDFPFAHLNFVNSKGDYTNDGSRKGIRLLKNLRADCDDKLDNLSSFQLTTIVDSIESNGLMYQVGAEITIAQAISKQLGSLIDSPSYRRSVKSPNGLETPLEHDEIVPDLLRIKLDLDTLIGDASKDIANSYIVKRSLATY
ncbi:MAG: hypothetical protein EOO61_01085 [Hymenobacter sp.]|nr:MAG: hypothetical protein EOO61_01085 [Hymenobacter sp.]